MGGEIQISYEELQELITDREISLADVDRFNAILSCYGLKAMLVDKEETLESGEIISAWTIDGFNDTEDLFKVYTLDIIIDIYDSGI